MDVTFTNSSNKPGIRHVTAKDCITSEIIYHKIQTSPATSCTAYRRKNKYYYTVAKKAHKCLCDSNAVYYHSYLNLAKLIEDMFNGIKGIV